jgi:hypothetical protein
VQQTHKQVKISQPHRVCVSRTYDCVCAVDARSHNFYCKRALAAMACCGSSSETSKSNKQINKQLEDEKKKVRNHVKILLLGTSFSRHALALRHTNGVSPRIASDLVLVLTQVCRYWRIGQKHSRKTNEDHSLGRFLGGREARMEANHQQKYHLLHENPREEVRRVWFCLSAAKHCNVFFFVISAFSRFIERLAHVRIGVCRAHHEQNGSKLRWTRSDDSRYRRSCD